jgi:hypothetical protein
MTRFRLFKLVAVFCWLLLLLLLVQRDFFISALDRNEQTVLLTAKYQQYYGVKLYGKRIGWVMEDFRPLDKDRFSVRQQASLRLKVLNSVQPVQMDLHAELDSGMRLKEFNFTFSSSFYSTEAEGRTEGGTVHFTLNTGRAVIQDTVTLPDTPLLPLNQRGYLLNKMSKTGDKLKVPFFDPFSLTQRESVITYLGPDKELIGGRRVHTLHEFTESHSGMKTRFWLDDTGKIIKEESPAGFVFEAEPKFKAMDIQDSGDELLAAVAVKYSGKLPPDDSQVAQYHLDFPVEAEVELNGGRQQFADGVLTLRKEIFPPQTKGSEQCAAAEYLQSSRYVQVDDARIIDKAKEIVGEETDPVRQVRLLTDWVYKYLDKRPVIGLPDALTTLESGLGDCNEHAALFAALSRSLNIPTAIAAGVTLQKDAFYYHAWNEVCIQGQWISLDTTTNQLPADIYHIRFTRADVEGQVAIGALLGKLQIEALPSLK